MIAAASQHADVGDLRQMPCEQAADDAAADDADAFDHPTSPL